jgi:hypothetical protein
MYDYMGEKKKMHLLFLISPKKGDEKRIGENDNTG